MYNLTYLGCSFVYHALLPEDLLLDLSSIVKKFLALNGSAMATSVDSDEKNIKDEGFAEYFPLFGCAEGKVWIADDFDAPLEEMEEYMQ